MSLEVVGAALVLQIRYDPRTGRLEVSSSGDNQDLVLAALERARFALLQQLVKPAGLVTT